MRKNLGYWKHKLIKYTYYLEVVLAFFIIAATIVGMVDLVKYLALILRTSPLETYNIFQKFLGHVLMLVVGVELVIMLLSHTTSSVLEVMLYAIARKLLIFSDTTLDIAIGIIAIGMIFAIRKYLFTKEIKLEGHGNVFSAATSVADANTITGLNIPEHLGNTIGGVIAKMAENTNRPIYEGIDYRVGNAKLKVISMKDGLIEKVVIENLDE
ncbi:phosphate-starvation-inducible PsiE family protein [Lutispora thermophila]|uniref:Transporter associated domain-containing protein n=1 Tax=Lutispora thermophila DSM 19022 TaxID=1122184 RepID=A0A1M6HPL6_9FIRM|nr:phosphate-starvation-inducible PsiE family protein [Lutispora thermophila]SHJ24142.1 Transporter associated domain-containing protein [Lutispora thermophila DSM 19022]